MAKNRRLFLGFLVFSVVVLALFIALFIYVLPYQKELQNWMQSLGLSGLFILFAGAVVTTVIVPLNYIAVALGGGFIYGTWTAFLVLWLGRSCGGFINYYLGHRYGRKVLGYFIIDDEQSKKYDQMFQSEKAALLYFILCFLPFLPNDYAAYFIGFSSQKKEVFIPITLLGNLGSSFSLAYLGSGKAFGNPFFLTAFTILFTSGLYWIHAERKKFHLR